MTLSEAVRLLESSGALKKGHFLLSSGLHSDSYFEKFRALEDARLALKLGSEIAERFKARSVEVVLSPAVGGIVIGLATAAALGVRFIFAERVKRTMTLRRGFEIAPGENVAVVDDVVTTGGSLKEILALVPPGELVATACLVDRRTDRDGMTIESLLKLNARSFDPADCPSCKAGEELVAPGSKHLQG